LAGSQRPKIKKSVKFRNAGIWQKPNRQPANFNIMNSSAFLF